MACWDLQCASINLTTPESGQSFGLDWRRIEIPCNILYHSFWPNWIGVLRWLLIGSMIGPCHLSGRFCFPSPAHIWDSKDLGIPTHLFSRMGLTEQHRQAETGRAFKRKLYDTWQTMSIAETKQREVRIVQLQPATDWSLEWGPSPQRNNAWLRLINIYMAIHDIIPTNAWLNWIRLMVTYNCTYCRRQYTTVHLCTVWGWDGDLGMDPHTDSTDIKDGPKSYG